MTYSNATVNTKLTASWTGSLNISTIAILQNVPYINQIEVTRTFVFDRENNPTVTQFLMDENVSLDDKRKIFVIPISRITVNETTKYITDIDLPLTGNTYNFTYTKTTGNTVYSILVPKITVGDILTVSRKTISNQLLVNWSDGTKLTSSQLNLNATQSLYLQQEILNRLDTDLISKNIPSSSIADGTVTPAKIYIGSGDIWYFNTKLNIIDPTTNTHATTRQYVLNSLYNHSVITSDNQPSSSATNILETSADRGLSGVWFNPYDGKLKVKVKDTYVNIFGMPTTESEPYFNLVNIGSVATPDNRVIIKQVTTTENVGIASIESNPLYSGLRNTGVGYKVLASMTSAGTNNTAIGYQALTNSTTYVNCTGVGSNSNVTGSNQVQLGDENTTVYAYGSVASRSDIRDKKEIRNTTLGLNFILNLRPVDYKWDYRDSYRTNNSINNITTDGTHLRNRFHHGFIAQEVNETCNNTFGGYQDHSVANGEDCCTLGYTEFIAPMVKAIQELYNIIEQQQTRINILESGNQL
ncbi:Intramolecular chaperone auto-processing domain containing protein [uncultured Caudovirales phage]|uniref:Intramolecular chaperone auto-processing domain containing protein n=1 Tax=uncultured Caudovirales phage TaxID=2100421 RepID=A0A6J5R7Q2_9CAUD|nr:Intramolecular chaperone auto-processing domain containing protein [uncultured Caudovirales phage]